MLLLDLFTLQKALGSVEGKRIAIVGDIKNSRVANSNIELLTRFGAKAISLRTQTERHQYPIYASLRDYSLDYKITKKLLGERNIVLLHPGPVHRNIDIDDEMLDDPRSLVLKQVEHGVVVRMAVLEKLILGQ